MATAIHTIQSKSLPTVGLVKSGRCYTLRIDSHEVLVDPTDKGKPGDIVVLWPKKKAPLSAGVSLAWFRIRARPMGRRCCPTVITSRISRTGRCSTSRSARWRRSTRWAVLSHFARPVNAVE